jgi:hypothetical protein
MSKAIRGVLCSGMAAGILALAAMPAVATEGWSTGEPGSASDEQCQSYADQYDGLRDQSFGETEDASRRMWNAADGWMDYGLGRGCFFIEPGPDRDPGGSGGPFDGSTGGTSTCESDDDTTETPEDSDVTGHCEDGGDGGGGKDTTPGSCNRAGLGNCAEGGPDPNL